MRKPQRKGKEHEVRFRTRWEALGKDSWLYRFEDPSDLYGLNNQKMVRTSTKPADFLGFYRGWTGLIEAKSCGNPKGFPVSYLADSQRKAARRTLTAGGNYLVVIEDKHLRVYVVPVKLLLEDAGVIPWSDLESYLWPAEQKEPPL